MIAVLLLMMLVGQGIPLPPQQAGTVTGVLKDTDGRPLPGIRMAAVARPDSISDLATVSAMAGIAQTDEEGRYKLENIPPGRYFIAAGRLDVQTYYPGTPDAASAKEVAVVAGATVSGVDFALGDFSYGRSGSSITLALPFRVSIEGGGALPVSGNGGLTTLKLEALPGSTNAIRALLTNIVVNVPGPQTAAYNVTVENLPDTYVVKSMTYGATDLLTDPLRLSPLDFPAIRPQATSTDQLGLQAALEAALRQLVGGVVVPPSPPPPPAPPLPAAPATATPPRPRPTLSITLAKILPKDAAAGVRVSGQINSAGARSILLSGIPGSLLADGSFEFFGVPPGLHTIVTRNNPGGSKPLAASIVVGDRDLGGIVPTEISLIPMPSTKPAAPRPAGSYLPGPIPLARISGTVVEDLSHLPVSEGTVSLRVDGYGVSFPVDPNGHFETLPLLPGVYNFEMEIFGHSTIRESLEVEDKDLKIELHTLKLY